MPEDSKKNQHKLKHDPKDQRKPRRQNQPPAEEKKAQRCAEEPKTIREHRNKVPALPASPKPAPEEPGPEFYKSLKRETDDILKITEEASKFKKKEIQSNWAKYEMPIESYDEMEEAENLGADYEKLIQTPMSIGGHFQFKHEKSWDVTTEPSMYDKFFEINMDNLATAISTIPFYERNSINLSEFSETDTLSMENRSVKYKRKYFDDKSFTTTELEAQERIAHKLSESMKCDENIGSSSNKEIDLKDMLIKKEQAKDSKMNSNSISPSIDVIENIVKIEDQVRQNNKNLEDIDTILSATLSNIDVRNASSSKKGDNIRLDFGDKAAGSISKDAVPAKVSDTKPSKPIIESPVDLEKWLDDFLEG